MKKFYTLLAAVSLMFGAAAQSLLLYDGTGFDYYVPINSLFLDEANIVTQVIYPAEDLSPLQGKTITSMTFYTDNYGCYMDGGQLVISLGETASREMTAFITDGLTEVATISMTKHTGETVEITVDFTTPYQYNGGNLVFQSFVAQAGGYGMTYFMGVRTNYCTGMAYSFGNANYKRYFLPKTLFTYSDEQPVVEQTAKPAIQAEVQLGIHAYFVTITPAEESDLYYRYSKDNGEWSEWMPYDDVLAFDEDGYYTVQAYAVAVDKTESELVETSFQVEPRTSIDELSTGKSVTAVRYYNVAGQQLQQPQGLTIQVTTYSDGTITTAKVLK